MTDQIYAPPNAELADINDDSDLALHEFYVVSERKLGLLFFATLGIYVVYWFYRNWKLQKQKHQLHVWPVARGIFSVFFTHSLFEEIDLALEKRGVSFRWSPSILATIYVVFQILSGASERLSASDIGSPFTDFAGIFLLAFVYYPILQAQKAINLAVDDPSGSSNSSYSVANIIWLILGGILWLMVLLGIAVVLGLVPA